MDKVFTQLCYPGNAFMRVGYADHGFGALDGDIAYLFKFIYKMKEQRQRVRRFTG
jgi:hypothetical protein